VQDELVYVVLFSLGGLFIALGVLVLVFRKWVAKVERQFPSFIFTRAVRTPTVAVIQGCMSIAFGVFVLVETFMELRGT
jgi:hypothetical protein